MKILSIKTQVTLFLITALLSWYYFVLPKAVFAANATETFHDGNVNYTDGASITGLNGGSGWGGAWTTDLGDFAIEATGCQVANCAFDEGTSGDSNAQRNLSAGITNGTITFYYKAANDAGIVFLRNSTPANSVRLGPSGTSFNFLTLGNTEAIMSGSYVAGTWYQFEVEWGAVGTSTCTTNQARAREVATGDWSGCKSFANNGDVANFQFDNPGAAGYETWIDDVSITDAAPPAAADIDIQYTPIYYFNEI